MDALLIERWMHGLDAVPTIDVASVSLARQRAREEGAAAGLGAAVIESAALVASELATNQLAHARRGQIAVRRIARAGVGGVEIVAADLGPGIARLERALAGVG